MRYNKFKKFLTYIKKLNKTIYIQPHNFPDPDALASSYGLKKIFDYYKIDSKIIFFGPKLSLLNKELIDVFGIEVEEIDRRKVYDNKIAMDGHPENVNFINTKGKFIAYFDHHIQKENKKTDKKNNVNKDIIFKEVDSKIGSTSTIIAHYILHFKIPISKKLSTFLNIGVYTDTKGLSRKTSSKDLFIFNKFYFNMNKDIFTFFTGNSFEKKDISYLNESIKNLKIVDDKGLTFIEGNFSPSLLGIIADTILRIIEVNFVLIVGFIGDSIYLSTRSISSKYNCFEYFKKNFSKIAYFGGHNEMAGGQFIEKDIHKKEVLEIIGYNK